MPLLLADLDIVGWRDELLAKHGPQLAWWPGGPGWRMMASAVLVQNTAWGNVERSLARLESAGVLTPTDVLGLESDELEGLIRPSGTMRRKAVTLQALAAWATMIDAAALPDAELRASLLVLHGIGPETADVIALYTYGRPAFITDSYARRLLTERGYTVPRSYEAVRQAVAPSVLRTEFSVAEWAELHGLIVEEGKSR